MKYAITYLLFKLKLLEPSKNAITYWKHNNAVEKLEYVLKYGNYKTRQFAAEALEHVGSSSSIPVLLTAMNDHIHKVSIAALNALERLGCDDELLTSTNRKRFYWVKTINEKEEKLKNRKPTKHNIHRWERPSKKSFEAVKERLKRPIR